MLLLPLLFDKFTPVSTGLFKRVSSIFSEFCFFSFSLSFTAAKSWVCDDDGVVVVVSVEALVFTSGEDGGQNDVGKLGVSEAVVVAAVDFKVGAVSLLLTGGNCIDSSEMLIFRMSWFSDETALVELAVVLVELDRLPDEDFCCWAEDVVLQGLSIEGSWDF